MDVVYFSQAVENYMPYLDQSLFGGRGSDVNVGRYMIDMIANILGVPPNLMALGNLRFLYLMRCCIKFLLTVD